MVCSFLCVNRQKSLQVVAAFLAIVLVLALVGGLLASSGGGGDDGGDPPVSTLANGLEATDNTGSLGPPVTVRHSDLPSMTVQELPPEAVATAQLILEGGPFPYPQDGGTFENREGLLPDEAEGYYKEYTVPTPGSEDRGPRRLVVGEEGGLYYTEDHYESFREVVGF